MSSTYNWLKQTPNWVWWSLFPHLGGLAICYAGFRSRTFAWVALGLGVTVGAIALSGSGLVTLVWLGQVGVSLYLRKSFLIKTCAKSQLLPIDRPTAQLIARHYGKIDVNKCSKHELVYHLGLPIIYANQIDRLRQQGMIFINLQQLVSQGGLPASYLDRLEPLVVFDRQSLIPPEQSWQCLNSFSVEELITCGVSPEAAVKIVAEREGNGLYESLAAVNTRTGIPFHQFNHLGYS